MRTGDVCENRGEVQEECPSLGHLGPHQHGQSLPVATSWGQVLGVRHPRYVQQVMAMDTL